MKSFTDLEQSKRLANMLPLKSADQTWERIAIAGVNLDVPEELQYRHNGDMPFKYYSGIGLPCWSLAALLSIYPMIVGRDMDMYCCWQNSKNLHSRHYDNPVDAAFEMILKLKENNLL